MSESAHFIDVRFFLRRAIHTHTENGGRGWRGEEGKGRGEEGQYARKHLDGIETMSRFQVARGQFFRGVVLKHLGSVDVQSQHP